MNDDGTPVKLLKMPFIYGTAWREDETRRLTRLAIEQGFRAIDTANQRKHYHEAAVGDAIQDAIHGNCVTRADLFLQTKFTFQSGQDHRLPYDPSAPIEEQVQQSLESSLEHLGVDYVDSYVLHGPSRGTGLDSNDWGAWHAMEGLQDAGVTKLLGISNVSLEQLKLLVDKARIPPAFVQNRCYAIQRWGQDVRAFCNARGIIYQAFSLLTANAKFLSHPTLLGIAENHQRNAAQVVFRYAIDSGMVPLTGTSQKEHMLDDLSALEFRLSPVEREAIENIAT